MNDFFTSFYVPEKYHFGMDDTVLDVDESVRFITFFEIFPPLKYIFVTFVCKKLKLAYTRQDLGCKIQKMAL